MAEIIRNRTIRPSSRLETSTSYKIDTKQIATNDVLIVNINHETKPFQRTFRFSGSSICNKNSIHFSVYETKSSINISWIGAQPIGSDQKEDPLIQSLKKMINKDFKNDVKSEPTNTKFSFEPISNDMIKILILGTLPGDKSIEIGEYYGHAGNRFWKIIATITNSPIPGNYEEKTNLLLKNEIGIWDVAQKADRKGSLDKSIQNESPNDIEGFMESHKFLKIIAFNGSKAEILFDKYFTRNHNIKYLTLPSSSPANTGYTLDDISKKWKSILS